MPQPTPPTDADRDALIAVLRDLHRAVANVAALVTNVAALLMFIAVVTLLLLITGTVKS